VLLSLENGEKTEASLMSKHETLLLHSVFRRNVTEALPSKITASRHSYKYCYCIHDMTDGGVWQSMAAAFIRTCADIRFCNLKEHHAATEIDPAVCASSQVSASPSSKRQIDLEWKAERSAFS
jgi:hypothetical protein